MTERAGDDFASIAARLKQIQAERSSAIVGKPEEAPKNTESTKTGSGGFVTPDGQPYQAYEG